MTEMINIFDYDNAFYNMVRKILYFIELSILWVFFSLPVITIGSASAALYYSIVKAVRREYSYPAREFFRAFRANLKNGIIITILLLLAGITSGLADVVILFPSFKLETVLDYLLIALFVIKVYLFLGVLLHIFPLMSRFENGVIRLMEKALMLTVRHFVKTFFLIVLFVIIAVVLKGEILFAAIVPALYYWEKSFLLEPMYQKYYPPQKLECANGIADTWYADRDKAKDIP